MAFFRPKPQLSSTVAEEEHIFVPFFKEFASIFLHSQLFWQNIRANIRPTCKISLPQQFFDEISFFFCTVSGTPYFLQKKNILKFQEQCIVCKFSHFSQNLSNNVAISLALLF